MPDPLKALHVTMNVEALLLENDQVASTPLGEYGELQWLAQLDSGRYQDVYFNNAYLAEEVVPPPFKNQGTILRKGVHLHWIVPSFLGLSLGRSTLPAAPNRWRVQKLNQAGQITAEWLVVSDYVHYLTFSNIEGIELDERYSIFPVSESEKTEKSQPPFCYLGKSYKIDEVPSNLEEASFKRKFNRDLTVLGFGNTQFSASYPNCKSIFGFHDPDGKVDDSYRVTGWHANQEDDVLRTLIGDKVAVDPVTKYELDRFLREEVGLESELGTTQELMDNPGAKTLYVAQIEIDQKPPEISTDGLQVSVGNTPGEALSGLAAQKAEASNTLNKVQLEDQFEFFQMNATMDGLLMDHVPKFMEARHAKGFVQHQGSTLYEFRKQKIAATEDFQGYELTENLFIQINELNLEKSRFNEMRAELLGLRSQLFTDWHKYMRASYPPLGALGDLPNRDELQNLIEHTGVLAIRSKEQDINNLTERLLHQRRDLYTTYKAFVNEKITSQRSLMDGVTDAGIATRLNELRNILAQAKDRLSQAQTSDLEQKENTAVKAAEETLNTWQRNQSILNLLTQSLSNVLVVETGLSKLTVDSEKDPIKEIPEQVFWEPTEPVIAIDGFEFGSRSQEATCVVGTYSMRDGMPEVNGDLIRAKLKLSELEWCPFYMEWDVSLDDRALNTRNADSFFEHLYLDNDSPGIYRKNNDPIPGNNDAFFQGGVILSPYANQAYLDGMANYINYCLTRISELEQRPTRKEVEIQAWDQRKAIALEAILQLCNQQSLQELANRRLRSLRTDRYALQGLKAQLADKKIEFWEEVLQKDASGSDILAQKLAGFNAACLMLRQGPQLEMREPIGFQNGIDFTKSIEGLTSKHTRLSPAPMYEFLPIRSGKLKVRQLRFIDNFGIWKDLKDFDQIITADTLTSQELRTTENINVYASSEEIRHLLREVFLPPRLVQPARLNVHFLEEDEARLTENPRTNPIHGWLVPSLLDESIMVFTTDGQAVGTLQKNQPTLQPLPWDNTGLPALHPHLEKVIEKITASDGALIDSFLTAFQGAQQNIAPEDFSIENAQVLLVGRPIAVVRVEISLQIKGYPALDQGWSATHIDSSSTLNLASDRALPYTERTGGNWANVSLPLRLGEYGQLNDGLVGYWKEQENGDLLQQFYAPQTGLDDTDAILSKADVNLTDNKSNGFIHEILPDGQAHSFTLLLDPHGTLHATTGVLPTEKQSIPTPFFKPALEKIHVWFKTGPILQFKDASTEPIDPDTIALDLPAVPNYEWKWYSGTKTTRPEQPELDRLYDRLPFIKNGYLMLVPSNNNDITQ